MLLFLIKPDGMFQRNLRSPIIYLCFLYLLIVLNLTLKKMFGYLCAHTDLQTDAIMIWQILFIPAARLGISSSLILAELKYFVLDLGLFRSEEHTSDLQ